MMISSKSAIAFVLMSFLCQLYVAEAATTSVVRWDQPFNTASIDPVGARRSVTGKTLTVCLGDSVAFNWQMNHGLVQDKRAPWAACNLASPTKTVIQTPITPGSVTILMATPGARYYYCQVAGHCAGGQKIKVVVRPRACP